MNETDTTNTTSEEIYDNGEWENDYDDSHCDDAMDGDFDSGMRDAGMGTDEDYGYYGEDCDF